MEDDTPGPSPLPENPDLRDIAQAMEAAGYLFEIHDARFRCVYFSNEWARFLEVSADEARRQIGRSSIARAHKAIRDAGSIAVTPI